MFNFKPNIFWIYGFNATLFNLFQFNPLANTNPIPGILSSNSIKYFDNSCSFVETSNLSTSFISVSIPTTSKDFVRTHCSKSLGFTQWNPGDSTYMGRGQTILTGNTIRWWNDLYQESSSGRIFNQSQACYQFNDSRCTYYWIAIKYND